MLIANVLYSCRKHGTGVPALKNSDFFLQSVRSDWRKINNVQLLLDFSGNNEAQLFIGKVTFWMCNPNFDKCSVV